MENKVRLIDRNRLVKCLKNKRLHILNENENNGAAIFDDIIEWIEYEPEIYVVQKEADVAPVVHGKWVDLRKGDGDYEFQCSNCKEIYGMPDEDITPLDIELFYCPHCGAKMDLEE